jgi:uncharacterized protein YozE (UPF0346 family)
MYKLIITYFVKNCNYLLQMSVIDLFWLKWYT